MILKALLIAFFFFFLMIRRPPRSTLFPYHDALPISDGRHRRLTLAQHPGGSIRAAAYAHHRSGADGGRRRSEEHTSELQSLTNLGCRLLLYKQTPDSPPSPPQLSCFEFLCLVRAR